jgi:hypothetical protein
LNPNPNLLFQIDNKHVIDINDTIVPVKSLIPKDKNEYVYIFASKEWQLACPCNDTITCITNRTFVGQYRNKRNDLALLKITQNKRSGKIKEKLVYHRISKDNYLKSTLKSDYHPAKKTYNIYAHRLFATVVNENDDIFRNTDCVHINRFRWCNRPENTRWVTSLENMDNKGS